VRAALVWVVNRLGCRKARFVDLVFLWHRLSWSFKGTASRARL